VLPAPDDQTPLRQTVAEISIGRQREPSAPQEEVRGRDAAATSPKAAAAATVLPTTTMPAGAKSAAAGQSDVPLVRPVYRPPTAVLWIFDDGGRTSEQVRIRSANYVIGRTEGDLKIGHDMLISSKHAEIVRVQQEAHWRWHLYDLGSSNGTFARVKLALLKDDAEFMIARRRFRFIAASDDGEEEPAAVSDVRQTLNWRTALAARPARGVPCLEEMLPAGEGRRFCLTCDSLWIGRDGGGAGDIAIPEDAALSPHHARVFRDTQDRWHVEDADSVNGVWLRVPDVALTAQSVFLLGEQMFAFTVP
jgi:pSer/pThr/pTyr-binding forkhead associated (FHA) protein